MDETAITAVEWKCEKCGERGDGWESMREHYDGCRA